MHGTSAILIWYNAKQNCGCSQSSLQHLGCCFSLSWDFHRYFILGKKKKVIDILWLSRHYRKYYEIPLQWLLVVSTLTISKSTQWDVYPSRPLQWAFTRLGNALCPISDKVLCCLKPYCSLPDTSVSFCHTSASPFSSNGFSIFGAPFFFLGGVKISFM